MTLRWRSVTARGSPVVPNHFTVYLSSADYTEFGEVRDALRRELCDAARAHARDEGYRFMGPVDVELVVDESFGTGWFEIEGRFREGAGGAGAGSLVLPTGDRFTLEEHVISIGRRCLVGANAGIGISLGDECVVEAGLYVTAGTRVKLADGQVVKARQLSGHGGLLYRRHSQTGAVEAVPRSAKWEGLNAALHAN